MKKLSLDFIKSGLLRENEKFKQSTRASNSTSYFMIILNTSGSNSFLLVGSLRRIFPRTSQLAIVVTKSSANPHHWPVRPWRALWECRFAQFRLLICSRPEIASVCAPRPCSTSNFLGTSWHWIGPASKVFTRANLQRVFLSKHSACRPRFCSSNWFSVAWQTSERTSFRLWF